MASLATSVRWGTETPAIYFDVSYTASRSGANMVYTVNVDFQALSSNYGRYFGYPIYLDLSLDGVAKVTKTTVKNASPSNWSAGAVKWHSADPPAVSLVVAKTTGTVSLVLKIYSGEGSSRSQTYTYSLPVSPAATVLSLPSAGFTIGSAGAISITRYDSTFADTITYSVGSASGTITTIASGSTTSSYSWTPPASLYSQMAGATSKSGTITVTTKSGTTTVGTNSYTFALKGYAPSSLTLPSGGFTIGVQGSFTVTRNNSSFYDTIAYSVGTASGTISTIASGGNTTKNWTPPVDLYLQMVGQYTKNGTITITTKTSSSGTTVGSRSYSFTLNVSSVYNAPMVTMLYQRGTGTGTSFVESDDGPNLRVRTSVTVYGGLTATYTLKLDGTEVVNVSGVTTGERVKDFENLSSQISHTVVAALTDTIGMTSSYTMRVSTQSVPMNINVDLPGVAFGKLAERANTIETLWDIITTGRTQAQYVDVANTTSNSSQTRYRFSDKDNAICGNAYVAFATGYGGRFYFREHSANSSGTMLSYYEQYRLPTPDGNRSSNATYDILTTKNDGQLTLTYTSNNYVSSSSFGYVNAFRKSNLYLIRGNMEVTTAIPAGTNWTQIGTIGNYSAAYTEYLSVAAQNGSGVLAVRIEYNGTISIANTSGSAVSGYCRFSSAIPVF